MRRHQGDGWIPTLTTALSEHMKADELKKLARLTRVRVPKREGEVVETTVEYLEGGGLQSVWQGLDELQRAAVAEVVYSG